jgi:hypothetical protein
MFAEVKLEKKYTFDRFYNLLSKYKDFKPINREYKINSLLRKKSIIEITDIRPPIHIYNNKSLNLYSDCIEFIIDSEGIVDRIRIDINHLSGKMDEETISYIDYYTLRENKDKIITGFEVKFNSNLL